MLISFLFFQAEDGIREYKVTGVQTCALPIFIIPIPEELELYEQAKKHLKQYSYRDVANWLSDQSGRHISHVGLYKRVRLEQKRKREAANQRYLAERYKAALDKAEKIEAQIRGGREESSPAEA